MNGTELATGVGRSLCWWERLLLGVVCLGGLIVLLGRLPHVPASPWAAVRPTGEDLIRTWGVVAVWLALGSALVARESPQEHSPAVSARATPVAMQRATTREPKTRASDLHRENVSRKKIIGSPPAAKAGMSVKSAAPKEAAPTPRPATAGMKGAASNSSA